MSTKPAQRQSSTDYDHDHDRSLDPDRYRRAVTEAMAVERAADRLYSVSNGDGEAYTVDLALGACTCPDWQYRGGGPEGVVCKHTLRAALVDVYRAQKARSALAARVIAFANEHGCASGTRGCNEPFRAHDDGLLPCPACIDSIRSGGVDEMDCSASAESSLESTRASATFCVSVLTSCSLGPPPVPD